MTIRNPGEWGIDSARTAVHALKATGHTLRHPNATLDEAAPEIRRISVSDLRDVLRKGIEDFGSYRTDVLFISIIYPIAGLVLARLALGYDMLPLIFPLASGFALLGPVAALGLYELSRRREAGEEIGWTKAFSVFRSPSIGAIVEMSLLLTGIFLLWLVAATVIYAVTLGPEAPASVSGFVSDVFTTGAGWAMIILGCGVGFLFALLVLTIGSITFPMLIDRRVSAGTAIRTSIRVMVENPEPMLAWGFIVAASLVIGALPLLWGLIIVMPVLGHATWHLYRKVVQ